MSANFTINNISYGPTPVDFTQGEQAFFNFIVEPNPGWQLPPSMLVSVALYDPPGNLVREFQANVAPATDGRVYAQFAWDGTASDTHYGDYGPNFSASDGTNTVTVTDCTGVTSQASQASDLCTS